MINFENSYLNLWKTTIDEAKHGLKGFLMRKNDDDFIFQINADEKYLIKSKFKIIKNNVKIILN